MSKVEHETLKKASLVRPKNSTLPEITVKKVKREDSGHAPMACNDNSVSRLCTLTN
jgi:hypothetical protein